MIKTIQKGFTLIELAIVIAIIAILAAVAIPRFADTTASAECSMIKDMAAQLNSGVAIYTAAAAQAPTALTQFAYTAAAPTTNMNATPPIAHNISLRNFGPNARNGTGTMCNVGANTVTCNGVFTRYNPTYTLANGAVTVDTPLNNLQAGGNICQ